MRHPLKRTDVSVQEIDGEAVLYDERTGAVHRFSGPAVAVWKACDGQRGAHDIACELASTSALDDVLDEPCVEEIMVLLASKSLLTTPDREVVTAPARLPSRRELLRGGTAKLVYTAPLISTFFATGACASGPSASAAFGADGCKTVGYSCANPPACCVHPGNGSCQGGTCCGFDGVACDSDADCCSPRTCSGGFCG